MMESNQEHQQQIVQQSVTAPDGRVYSVGIPPPPDYIYKYRPKNIAQGRIDVSAKVWGHGTITYIPQRAEYIDGKGCFVYFAGIDFPQKTVAPVQAIYASDPVKRKLVNDIKLLMSKEARFLLPLLLLIGKKRRARFIEKRLELLINEADVTLLPFYLEDGYYCAFVREIIKGISAFLKSSGITEAIAKRTAEIVGLLIEYDNAYRFRLQDLFNETNARALLVDFPKELTRLLSLHSSREVKEGGEYVKDKFGKIAKLLKLLWYVPSFRRAIKVAISNIDFNTTKMDYSDDFFTLLYADYNVRGLTLEERFKIYEDINGPDRNKWPPQIMIKQNL